MMFSDEQVISTIYISTFIYINIAVLVLFTMCCFYFCCKRLQNQEDFLSRISQDEEQEQRHQMLKDSIQISRELYPLAVPYIEEEDDMPNDVFYNENEEIDNRYTII